VCVCVCVCVFGAEMVRFCVRACPGLVRSQIEIPIR